MARRTKKLKHRKSSKKAGGLMKWLFGSKKSPRSPTYDPEKEREKYKKTAKKYLKNMGGRVKATRKSKSKKRKSRH